jgi:hypothetical protein
MEEESLTNQLGEVAAVLVTPPDDAVTIPAALAW